MNSREKDKRKPAKGASDKARPSTEAGQDALAPFAAETYSHHGRELGPEKTHLNFSLSPDSTYADLIQEVEKQLNCRVEGFPEHLTKLSVPRGRTVFRSDAKHLLNDIAEAHDLDCNVEDGIFRFSRRKSAATRKAHEPQASDGLTGFSPEEHRRQMIRIGPALEALEGRKGRPRLDDEREVPIPKWEELQSRGSITQDYAARLLRCSKKTVGRLADKRQLKRSDVGRIVCDEQLRHQMRKKHGQHILR